MNTPSETEKEALPVVRRLNTAAFLALANPTIHANLHKVAFRDGCEALVCFENMTFDSSNYGCRSFLGVGRGFTYSLSDITVESKIGSTPSTFKFAVAVLELTHENKTALAHAVAKAGSR